MSQGDGYVLGRHSRASYKSFLTMSHYKQRIYRGPSMGFLNGHDIMDVLSCTLCTDKSWKIIYWLTKLFRSAFKYRD